MFDFCSYLENALKSYLLLQVQKGFWLQLYEAGQRNTQRYTKGNDIAAACGQLALQGA